MEGKIRWEKGVRKMEEGIRRQSEEITHNFWIKWDKVKPYK